MGKKKNHKKTSTTKTVLLTVAIIVVGLVAVVLGTYFSSQYTASQEKKEVLKYKDLSISVGDKLSQYFRGDAWNKTSGCFIDNPDSLGSRVSRYCEVVYESQASVVSDGDIDRRIGMAYRITDDSFDLLATRPSLEMRELQDSSSELDGAIRSVSVSTDNQKITCELSFALKDIDKPSLRTKLRCVMHGLVDVYFEPVTHS